MLVGLLFACFGMMAGVVKGSPQVVTHLGHGGVAPSPRLESGFS